MYTDYIITSIKLFYLTEYELKFIETYINQLISIKNNNEFKIFPYEYISKSEKNRLNDILRRYNQCIQELSSHQNNDVDDKNKIPLIFYVLFGIFFV